MPDATNYSILVIDRLPDRGVEAKTEFLNRILTRRNPYTGFLFRCSPNSRPIGS